MPQALAWRLVAGHWCLCLSCLVGYVGEERAVLPQLVWEVQELIGRPVFGMLCEAAFPRDRGSVSAFRAREAT